MYNKEHIVIIGLGETGFACASFFARQKFPVVVLDSRESPPKLLDLKTHYPNVPVFTGGFLVSELSKATTIILSPGIPKDHPDLVKGILPHAEIIGDIELFAREAKAPVVAITGSNGKSTVTSLVGEMARVAGLRVAVGGNLGTPIISFLETNPELYVIELSSFQLETTYSLKPLVSTILNICPDHMDRYPTLEDYENAKMRIFKNCQSIVFNRDEKRWGGLPPFTSDGSLCPSGIPKLSFGLESPDEFGYGLIYQNNEYWLSKGSELLLPQKQLKLLGHHNIANALAALALGERVGLPKEAMLTTLRTFRGLSHRCEWVRNRQQVVWINDSKGTNVGATLAALKGLQSEIPGKWVLIAGGEGKNADFSPLKAIIPKMCRAVILIGKATLELEAVLGKDIMCKRANSMEEAVLAASHLAEAGDGVLLSPACASFDMFRNFEARGDAFKIAVQGLL